MTQEIISLSSLEQACFGFRTARAFAQKRADLVLIDQFCKKEKVEFLILRCETKQINLVHSLEEKRFFLMDTLLYFRYTLSQENEVIAQNVSGALHLTDALHRETTFETRTAISCPLGTHPNADAMQFYHHNFEQLQSEFSPEKKITRVEPEDENSLVEIAKTAFAGYLSHYHADSRLNKQKSDESYLDWAIRSARKEIADEVLVAKSDGEIKGFLTLRKNSPSEVEGLLFAVSPEAQGQGIGRSLMRAAFRWAYEEGAKEFIISTQITNLASQNLWADLGMKTYRTLYTFHKWFV